jgi:hypothetical protein
LICHHHDDYSNHYHQVPVLPHHIALSVAPQFHFEVSIFPIHFSYVPLLDTSISHSFFLFFSSLFFNFLSAGANGKGSIGIGINSRVKEVVNQKASNVIEVRSSHNHLITMMMMMMMIDSLDLIDHPISSLFLMYTHTLTHSLTHSLSPTLSLSCVQAAQQGVDETVRITAFTVNGLIAAISTG